MVSLDEIIDLTATADVVTVDTEGVSRMLGFSLCFDGLEEGLYFPLTHVGPGNATDQQAKKMYEVLKTRQHLVFHNSPHDIRVFGRNGYPLSTPFYDTMLMTHWVNEELQNYSLDVLTKAHGLHGKEMPEMMKAIIEMDGWDLVPVSLMREYSGNDAYITHRYFREAVEPKFFAEFTPELWETEQKFIRKAMIPMMELGIKVDLGFCIIEYQKGIEIMQKCKKELGMNPASGKQMKELLIDELKLPIFKHTKSCVECHYKKRPVNTHEGPPSFDKDAMKEYDLRLEKLGDHRARTILRYRGWQKVTSSNYGPYIQLCDEQSILHPNYNLHRTRTSRLSCSDPNLQQIPKASDKEWNGDSKKAFVEREGFKLWTIDFSQLQFRMAVAYAKQMDLVEIFNDATRDIFEEMAKELKGTRDDTKTLVYLMLFGGGGSRAAVAFGTSVARGRKIVNDFYKRYPKLRAVSNEAQSAAERLGYVVYWTGRRRHFFKGGAPSYRAFNAVIQGGEAEIMKRCMIALAEEVCDENCRMVLQIHDEIAFEIREGMEDEYLKRAQAVMERVPRDFCKYVQVDIAFKTSAKAWGEK